MARMRKVISKNKTTPTSEVVTKSSDVKVTIILCIIMLVVAYGASALIYNLVKVKK